MNYLFVDDLKKFTRTMNAKAKNTLRALESAQRELNRVSGQETMEGWFDA